MRTRIISAFPGTGKSVYHEKHPLTTLDSDSSNFSWIEVDGVKLRNPQFPENYIEHIKKNIGIYDFIFVSSHSVVREALVNNSIHPPLNEKMSSLNDIKKGEMRMLSLNF